MIVCAALQTFVRTKGKWKIFATRNRLNWHSSRFWKFVWNRRKWEKNNQMKWTHWCDANSDGESSAITLKVKLSVIFVAVCNHLPLFSFHFLSQPPFIPTQIFISICSILSCSFLLFCFFAFCCCCFCSRFFLWSQFFLHLPVFTIVSQDDEFDSYLEI